ncbi:GNAT family N-acetyltransferase [Nocardioides sp. InS609-2]|uniref:GNAT family N-acetyltransferase n=1 Tax=Nocardioides sp. InS609-2 TaxID=2760705 RepID=UPI0018261056|nr:GNAT family N-acetyltransferase [Nocardioides sp. InS609-2]MBA3782594.1 N-acetyltransferase [Nocardioides sp.]
MPGDVTVRNNPEQFRYEALVDGEVAGFAAYTLNDEQITFTHTEVADAFGGQGVGGVLARQALDDVRADGTRTVKPDCPFIKGWIERHPDYAPLVAP